ncbi:spore cortex biosynthesis protein YabQ [Vallitalea okinawensis]|uniref:spore cortex biosynthesis protein YabQ n=1 Tax=Vallitalea okinawensis TaxID=2078660 RepID=UPI0038CD243E
MVSEQALTFILTVLTGCLLGLVYDLIRIIRRIIRHNNIAMNMEDFLFFILCGFVVFLILFNDNYGEIRFFSLIGATLGTIIYFFSLSSMIVELGTRLILKLLMFLNLIINVILYPIKLVLNVLLFPFKILYRFMRTHTNKKLTKTKKWFKIKGRGVKRSIKVIFKKV